LAEILENEDKENTAGKNEESTSRLDRRKLKKVLFYFILDIILSFLGG
jgi:hypothetical protein